MRNVEFGRATAMVLALAGLFASASTADEAAQAILKKMDAAMNFAECSMLLSFEDAKATGATRAMGARALYSKDAGTLVIFESPARERGKRVLMIGDSMWLGAPGVSKPVRLSGKDSFMGTSFTNDDVMNLDKDDDYEATIAESGRDGWTLELKAKRRELPYQRARIELGPDFLPRKQWMYLLSGELAKTITFSEPRTYGSKKRPSALKVEDAMTKGASTTVRFVEIDEGRVDRSRLSPAGFMK